MLAPDADAATVARIGGLAEPLLAAVREAGAVASTFFRSDVKNWLKAGNSPVSEADIAVDTLLKERLMPIGGAAWLSEETEDDPARLNASRVWIVDPIDGTRAFLAGHPDWTISVALVENGRPLLAALYAPATNEMFVASAGRGTTLNDAPVTVASGTGLAGARVTGPKRLIDKMSAGVGAVAEQPKVYSLALRIARVAHGQLDVAFAGGSAYDWDIAAADLLVHEAGGALTNVSGETLIYNQARPMHGVLLSTSRSRLGALCDIMRGG